jgi:CsoR family transcriptional regulator, copper-sensing transcriptional repressor
MLGKESKMNDMDFEFHEHNSQSLDSHEHIHRQKVLARLARIEGHVRAVKRMVEQDKSCPDVLVQIAAIRSALNGVGRVILDDHMRGCMVDALQKDQWEQAFKDLSNALDRFVG